MAIEDVCLEVGSGADVSSGSARRG